MPMDAATDEDRDIESHKQCEGPSCNWGGWAIVDRRRLKSGGWTLMLSDFLGRLHSIENTLSLLGIANYGLKPRNVIKIGFVAWILRYLQKILWAAQVGKPIPIKSSWLHFQFNV
jgi:hypothetical protein